MRNPGGYLVIEDPDPLKSRGERHIRECDTFTCNHCNGVVKVTPASDLCQCKLCMGFVCMGCVAEGGCTPFERKLELYEKQERALKDRIDRNIRRAIELTSFGR